MYIGPWQEYKLAKLIEKHNQQDRPSQNRLRPPLLQATPTRTRSSRCFADFDDTASVASSRSGVSGYSTQSAPAQFQQNSAQVRLNEYCENAERSGRRGSTPGAPRQIARPRSSSSGTGRTSLGGVGHRPPGAKRPNAGAKASNSNKVKPPSLEDQRRSRILQMQRLYGLTKEDPEPEASQNEQEPTPIQNVDRSLSNLQATMRAHEVELSGNTAEPPPDRAGALPSSWLLPPLPEDPVDLSMSLGSSGGLIAWSKNLRPDELSPPATLASFFPAPT